MQDGTEIRIRTVRMILDNLDVWETETQRATGGNSLKLLNCISTQIWKTTSGL